MAPSEELLASLPPIPEAEASLGHWQSYVGKLVKARGWDKCSELEVFLLFSEEVGELAKAFRHHRELFQEKDKDKDTKHELALEMADVLSYLFDLAERLDIDLTAAAREKEAINRGRQWGTDPL